MFAQLVSCIHPPHINCVHVHCYNPLCPATASALRENTGLTELRLEGCDIDVEGISHLEQALRVNTTLRALDLSGNTVDSQGAEHLGKLSE